MPQAIEVCEEAHARLIELRAALEAAREASATCQAEAAAAEEKARKADVARLAAHSAVADERERGLVTHKSDEDAMQVRESLERDRAKALHRVSRREAKTDTLLKRLAGADQRAVNAESALVKAEAKLTDLEERMKVLCARNTALEREVSAARSDADAQRSEAQMKEEECELMSAIIKQIADDDGAVSPCDEERAGLG